MLTPTRTNPFHASSSRKKSSFKYSNAIILIQFGIIFYLTILKKQNNSSNVQNTSSHLSTTNSRPFNQDPHYEAPAIIAPNSFIQHKWHSQASPHINPNLKSGTCWCSGDDYCMCNPSLAIDTILSVKSTTKEKHVWLVQRRDTNQYATMGGFVEVGETPEQAVHRELKEEMNLSVDNSSVKLFGVYGDPKRDARRHTVSIVYLVELEDNVVPHAGDDAKSLKKIQLKDVESIDFFADHKTILLDYLQYVSGGKEGGKVSKASRILRDRCSF
ncbi:hypothetical protein CTEN210_12952 [Chaetoceros tenuissimus]|uniref:Nudix hydrolase domain-containing protein n=1 Tax=Chaetoceros tenuissimus TaxID=426638 RepID=A0AAD3HAS1_9STRA|nr:hypothetical protein CTEN210_12952 [Chaetoceros tenuissimus]